MSLVIFMWYSYLSCFLDVFTNLNSKKGKSRRLNAFQPPT